MSIAWSPGGEWLAVAAGEKVHLYDGQSLQEVQILDVGKWAISLAFSPQVSEGVGGSYLALAVKEGEVQLWKTPEGRFLCQIDAHLKGANRVAFHPDGRLLASAGNDGVIRLWEWRSAVDENTCPKQPAAMMIGGAYAVSDIAFSPDGRVAASAYARIVHLRDAENQRLIRTLYGETSIFSIAFSPDGKWLAGAETDGIARLWQVETGQAAAVLTRPAEPAPPSGHFMWSIGFSPNGQLLAGGASDGLVVLWAFANQPVLRFALAGHTRAATSLAFSPDGRRLATGSLDGSVILWGIP